MSVKYNSLADSDRDDNGVALYIFRYKIGEREYGGEIPALNVEDAAAKVAHFGATIDGRATDVEFNDKFCCICAEPIRKDISKPGALDEEWPVEIDE